MKSLIGRRFAVGTKESGLRASKKIAKVPIYKTEAEAKADWRTIAPKYRTKAMLAEMLTKVQRH